MTPAMNNTPVVLSAQSVSLYYPIYNARSQSLRQDALRAVGGRLLRRNSDKAVFVEALSNVSFQIHEGERVGIYGHNGSGKTTLLRILAGIYEPSRGAVRADGEISALLELGFGMSPEQTGRRNVYNLGMHRGMSRKRVARLIPDIEEFAELGNFFDLPVRTYSAGMQARLAFAFATASDPDILILDEWISPGDANFIGRATERMKGFAGRARALVLASHSQSILRDVCTRLLVLDKGRLIYNGDPKLFFADVA